MEPDLLVMVQLHLPDLVIMQGHMQMELLEVWKVLMGKLMEVLVGVARVEETLAEEVVVIKVETMEIVEWKAVVTIEEGLVAVPTIPVPVS